MTYFSATSKQSVVIISKDLEHISVNVFMRAVNKTNKIRLYKHQLKRCGAFGEIKAGDTILVAYGYEKNGSGQWYGVNEKTKMTSPVDIRKMDL